MVDPPSTALLWVMILLATALLLALVVTVQIVASYYSAYMAAPRDITTFIDAVDFSIQENESYDRDVVRVQRLEDKMRLGRLLREIQRGGDNLREDLNRLLVIEGSTALRTSSRILWAGHRKELEERVRRLDLLRMRFLVVYMGIMTTMAGECEKRAEMVTPKDPETLALTDRDAPRPHVPRSSTESTHKRPPLRRLRTQAMGHSDKVEPPHRIGWLGVVQELQKSPRMKNRHASIEASMRSPPLSPLGSPTLGPMGKSTSLNNLSND